MRWLVFSTLFCLVDFCSTREARAQTDSKPETYTLESFDGRATRVTLYRKLFSGRLSVSIPSDQFIIDNDKGTISTRIISRQFLAVTYVTYTGPMDEMHHTVLICVKQGKLYQAAHLESHYDEYSDGKAHLFDLRLKLTGDNAQNYQLVVRRCDERITGDLEDIKPHYRSAGTLRFDPVACCFYSSYKAINKTVNVYDPKAGKRVRQKFGGPYPYAQVGTDKYYVISREWYGVAPHNLYKYSYR